MWTPKRQEIGICKAIQGSLELGLRSLPSLIGSNVSIYSDYGGSHKDAKYLTYSFLVLDNVFAWVFLEECKLIRSSYLGQRTMSYKNLNDGHRRRALVPLLRAANTLPGFLVVFTMEKSVETLFDEDWQTVFHLMPEVSDVKVRTLRKLFHVAHLAALAVCPWLDSRTNILWVSDDDDFTANTEMVRSATKIVASVLSEHAHCDLGHFRFGAASVVDKDMQCEDLLSIADLSCGAVTDTADLWHIVERDQILSDMVPLQHLSRKEKATLIMGWLAYDDSFALRKTVIRLRSTDNGEIVSEVAKSVCDPVPEFNPFSVLNRHLT